MKHIEQFKYQIYSCKEFAKGIIVTGKVQKGKISPLNFACLCANSSKGDPPKIITKISIIRIYISNREVKECSKGQLVSLYIEGVTKENIVPNRSYLTNINAQTKKNENKKDGYMGTKEHNKQELINNLLKTDYEQDGDSEQLLTSAEKNYVRNIRICINSTGTITPTEIYVLDKIRQALKISPERGRELFQNTLDLYKKNRDESIYKDAVAMCLLDGNYITKSERRLLVSLQSILGISDSKAYEIEDNSKW